MCLPVRQYPVRVPALTELLPETLSAWGNAPLWDREYVELRCIPSSHRETPSHAFQRLASFLPIFPGANVLDAGAGSGRHAVYLAARGCRVDAVDASGAACDLLRERLAACSELAGSVRVQRGVLSRGDLPEDTYDVILDSYVSCHLLSDDDRLNYLHALLSRLRRRGRLYTACMGIDDAYYRSHVLDAGPGPLVTADPLNRIRKLLQPRATFGTTLGDLAPTVVTTAASFRDAVAGRLYDRQVLGAVLHRR